MLFYINEIELKRGQNIRWKEQNLEYKREFKNLSSAKTSRELKAQIRNHKHKESKTNNINRELLSENQKEVINPQNTDQT